MSDAGAGARWLVLVYQFPKGPGSARVKIWRRLQGIGAVAIKHSVYALPMNEQTQEDFHWLLAELVDEGADGAILESRFVDGMSDQQVRSLFDAARKEDYAGLLEELRNSIDAFAPGDASGEAEAHRVLARARKRLAEIEAIDYFGADGRQAVDALIHEFSERISLRPDSVRAESTPTANLARSSLKERIWVTRRNVHVDRIASAWLIRRWIDPDAEFRFVAAKNYQAREREIRFDMFEGEFTHEGDKCTFEVLARIVAPEDVALKSVAEIVHDIDLKDGKFARPEAQGIANLLAGIVLGNDDDERRIERGSAIFDDLYRYLSESKT